MPRFAYRHTPRPFASPMALAGMALVGSIALAACQAPGASSEGLGASGGGGAASVVEDAGISCALVPEQAGCPCPTEGQVIQCYPGYAVGDDGSLTCEIGTQTCSGGQWTGCGGIETHVYESAGALISPLDTCNPCNPLCFRAVDTPLCDPAPGAACDLCTPARAAATGCTVNTDTSTEYSPSRGGITPRRITMGGMTPTLTDSDGDGVPDVADECPGAGAFRAADGSCYGDLFFYHTLPYGGPSAIDPAPIFTQIRTADVYVLMDTTGSMGGELSRLRTDLTSGSFLSGCGNGILGAIRCTIPDAWFGVGFHDDYAYAPFGQGGCSGGDLVLGHRTDITSSISAAQTGVNGLNLHCGYDGPESNIQAMYAVATGAGFSGYLANRSGCGGDRWGYPCWRSGTIPILINITDAPYHNGPPDPYGTYPYYGVPAPTWTQVVDALNARDIRVITVQSCGYWSDQYCLQGERNARALGNATGSLGSSGTPYVFRINQDGTGLSSAVVNAVRDLANYSRMDVSARASGDSWGFTRSITAAAWGPRGSCTGISGGTVFTQCLPGTDVRFNVEFRNTTVMPTMTAQIFNFFIEIVGDGSVVLARIPVRIVVPPVATDVYDPMATYWRDYDSTGRCDPRTDCADWSRFEWTADVPAGTSIRFEFRSASTAGAVPTASPFASYTITTSGPGGLDIGELLEAQGAANLRPFLRVTAVLISSPDRTRAPALSRFETAFSCVPCG
ncbi:MAG: hypothetical protein J0L92_22925 [Deltaproteobacteria bacterium]|nr:hypothetical protein [Deltaproteobacteria bacterium]